MNGAGRGAGLSLEAWGPLLGLPVMACDPSHQSFLCFWPKLTSSMKRWPQSSFCSWICHFHLSLAVSLTQGSPVYIHDGTKGFHETPQNCILHDCGYLLPEKSLHQIHHDFITSWSSHDPDPNRLGNVRGRCSLLSSLSTHTTCPELSFLWSESFSGLQLYVESSTKCPPATSVIQQSTTAR